MFKSRNEGNIVYKCTVRLLEDVDVLECEFQVDWIRRFRPANGGGSVLVTFSMCVRAFAFACACVCPIQFGAANGTEG